MNSPNDVAPHPDGSYWFTDPPFGGPLYEGVPDAPGGPSNAEGLLRRASVSRPASARQRELPLNVYRVDTERPRDIAVAADVLPGPPNGIAFSPDYKRLYVVSNGDLYAGEVGTMAASGISRFAEMKIDGVACRTDGVRVDVSGNLWCSSNAGAASATTG